MTLRGPNIAAEFKQLVDDYIVNRFGVTNQSAAE